MGKEKDKEQRRSGRPSLLTPELTKQICAYILAGAYDNSAAEACGISRKTFMEWMRRGEDIDVRPHATKFADFADSVRLARATARVGAEITVRKADPKFWLTHKHRDKSDDPGWSQSPTQLEVTGKEGARLGLTLEVVRQFLDATEPKDGNENNDCAGELPTLLPRP